MRPCRLAGRTGETRLVDAAPATRPRKPDSGGPQPAVRRHYDRLPTSRAARVDDEGAVATAPDKGRHGLSPTGSAAPRGQKPPQVERREAPSSDRKEEGDAFARCLGRLRQPLRGSRKPPRLPALRSPRGGAR